MRCFALRLKPGEEIVSSLRRFVESMKLKAAFVMTCVGSVKKASLRMAHATATQTNEVYACVASAAFQDVCAVCVPALPLVVIQYNCVVRVCFNLCTISAGFPTVTTVA